MFSGGNRLIDWYYHDPAQGRVGPHSAADLRNRYRDRRIQRDTLVWRHGLREWLPLDRVSDEVGLDDVVPDNSMPPPMPPPQAGATRAYPGAHPAAGTRAQSQGRHAPTAAPKKGLSGCLIALIVIAVLAIPMIGILAAIAIPAYSDYAKRAKVSASLEGQAGAIKRSVATHYAQHGNCPGNDSPGFAELRQHAIAVETIAAVRFGTTADGACGFEITLRNLGPGADGTTVLFEALDEDAGGEWDCTGGDLAERYRPRQCRASSLPEE